MQGDVSLTPLSTPTSDAGIIPRVLHRLFSLLDAGPSADYTVKCSYMEIYNEELRDLLAADYNSSRAATPLLLRDDSAKKGGGVVVQGLEEIGVKNTKEALALLVKGSTRRQTAETKMNSESSCVAGLDLSELGLTPF
jgi:kinesin family protein 11